MKLTVLSNHRCLIPNCADISYLKMSYLIFDNDEINSFKLPQRCTATDV